MNLEALRAIPKVELHRHLECSLRLSTFKEIAADMGMTIPPTEALLKDEFLVTSPMRDLDSVLKKFLRTQKVLASEEILTRITYEAIEDAFQEGIRILELRWSPTFILENHPGLSFEKIIRAIRQGVKLAQDLPIAVGWICIIQRIRPVEESAQIVDFALEHKDFFNGLDLADNEQGFDPRQFQKAFDKARANGLRITAHAGEADFPEASLNVKNSIEILGAERIGHGVQIAKDPFVVNLVRNKAIPLELCLTSNWLTQAVPSITAHPIKNLLQAGVAVTINTDDPGVFDTNLVKEYQLLSQFYGFTAADFDRCNDFAAQASFIPLIKRQKYWPRPIHSLR